MAALLKAGSWPHADSTVLMADSDDSYDFSHAPRFLKQLRLGSDLVMGNRFQGGIEDQAMPFLHRYLGNPVLSGIGRLFSVHRAATFIAASGVFARTAFCR